MTLYVNAVIVKVVAVVPPVVLKALWVPVLVLDEQAVAITRLVPVAGVQTWSPMVSVMLAELTPAVLELVADVMAIFDAAAALTVKLSALDRERGGEGKSVDLGGRRIIKKKT